MIADNFLFEEPMEALESSGAARHWPESRGIFFNEARTFLLWVNEQDQISLICMQKSADVKAVGEQLASILTTLEGKLEFAFNDHFGYVTACPSNLGTSMRVSVHVALKLASQQANFGEFCTENGLKTRSIPAEQAGGVEAVFDVSNLRQLGLTEAECITQMHEGLKKLVEWEKQLESEQAS
jgi:creatine kinase/arginine kinase